MKIFLYFSHLFLRLCLFPDVDHLYKRPHPLPHQGFLVGLNRFNMFYPILTAFNSFHRTQFQGKLVKVIQYKFLRLSLKANTPSKGGTKRRPCFCFLYRPHGLEGLEGNFIMTVICHIELY